MPNLEWNVEHQLVTPAGTLTFNVADTDTGYWYQLMPDTYKIGPTLRATVDNLSQRDGAVVHPRYKTGLTGVMKVCLWKKIVPAADGMPEYEPACGADLRAMQETLALLLDSIRTLTPNDQRFIWHPTGASSYRMLDFVQCQVWLDPALEDDGAWSLTFTLESPLPYAIDFTQQTADLSDGVAGAIVNNGTAANDPVVQVAGPFSAFTLVNNSVLDPFGNPYQIVYDSTLPGGVAVGSGHYAAIDIFRGTIYLDGDSTDLTSALDPTQTDFFPLIAGTNNLEITGADCTFLWNPSWS